MDRDTVGIVPYPRTENTDHGQGSKLELSEVQLANSKAMESLTRLLVVMVFKFEASNFFSSLFVTAVMKMMMTIMMMRMMSTTVIVTKMMMMMTMVMRMRIC